MKKRNQSPRNGTILRLRMKRQVKSERPFRAACEVLFLICHSERLRGTLSFLICHSERLRRSLSLSKGTEEESRNPENLSPTMPLQGILSRQPWLSFTKVPPR